MIKDKIIIAKIREYAQWEIDSYTSNILDYMDDDKVANAHIIGEFKETREHWRDIIRIIDGETDQIYMKYRYQ